MYLCLLQNRYNDSDLFDFSGQYELKYAYDIVGNLMAVGDALGDTEYIGGRVYNINGQLVRELMNNGTLVRSFDYDFQQRLRSIDITNSGGDSLFTELLKYNNDSTESGYMWGNIVDAQLSGSFLTGNNSHHTYSYNSWGRLEEVHKNPSNSDETSVYNYSYDRNGNILQESYVSSSEQLSRKYIYENSNNQLTKVSDSPSSTESTIKYDDSGSVVEVDSSNSDRLVIFRDGETRKPLCIERESKGSSRYAYDAFGRRVLRILEPDASSCSENIK